ncbi:hypothetical protein IT412_00510 [Candidatus Peregrinibacteria bacterium]|nr:hypothetical protein [Candidatus Peregrinibacteria bacterium]
MDQLNLNTEPENKPNSAMGSDNKAPANPANPGSISINFTPQIPSLDKKSEDKIAIPSSGPSLNLMSLEVKKEDLNKIDEQVKKEEPVKKGLFSGIFGGKKDQATPQPSKAWDQGLDTGKLNLDKPKVTEAPQKMDFFNSSALQEKSGSSKLMENIVTQKAKLEQPKLEDLLGKKSAILEKSIEQESLLKSKKKLRLVKTMAFVTAVAAIAVNGYLYYQLNPGVSLLGYVNYNFDNNLRNDLYNLNQSLRGVQTELNKYRYLSGQLYLNQFGYESTRFLDGVANLAENNDQTARAEIASVVGEAKAKLPELLAGSKQSLGQTIVVNTFKTRGEEQVDQATDESEFQRELRLAIINEKKAVRDANPESDSRTLQDEMSFLDNTLKLVGNQKLLANLNASTVDAFKIEADDYEQGNDPAQKASFKQYIDNLLASTKVNLATITNLRNGRIKWSDVLDRAEKITNQVNAEHNSGLGIGNASQISYSGFEFNSETGKVNLNGLNTTKSGTNREVVTYLIEALEASSEFKNVSNRSFPVSRTTDTTTGQEEFSMNFKIEMEIEKGAFSKLNNPIANLQAEKVAVVRVPVKKIK